MKTIHMALGILCGMAGLLAGCGGDYYRVNDPARTNPCARGASMNCGGDYYRVTDPAGDREYYTTDIDQTKTGSITFKDEKSGGVVTLQSSEVKEISEDEFKAAVKPEEKKGK